MFRNSIWPYAALSLLGLNDISESYRVGFPAKYKISARIILQRRRPPAPPLLSYPCMPHLQGWIEAVTEEPVIGTFGDALRDGVQLCKLINTIKPGAVRRVNESKMPFKQMENISNFLKSCRTMGVAEHSLFEVRLKLV